MPDVATTGEYLFLLRGADWDRGLAPGEVQDGLEKMLAWLDGMRARGAMVGGQPLDSQGNVVRHRQGTVTDGPFIETKEAVGGYLLIRARDLQEATAWAAECPVLVHGLTIEVRPIMGNCHAAEGFGIQMCETTA